MSNELFAALIAGSLAGSGGGSTETDDYNNLKNKPKINGTKLEGNLSLSDIGAATSDQGDKADSAVQPEDLGSAATADTSDFATAAQGGKADSAIQGIKVNSTTVNPDGNKVVNITIPTKAADVSALPDTTKYASALRLTINSSTFVVTGQLIDQDGNDLGTAQTIDLPLESVVVGGSYNDTTKKVVLSLQNGNTVEFSVADLVAGLQTELSATNKLNPAYIEYDSSHRAVSDTEKSTWNDKQNALTTEQLAAANSGINGTKVEQIETNKANISSLINRGAKNLLKNTAVSGTYRGVDYTVNADGTVSTYNSTTQNYFKIELNNFLFETGVEYVLSGCPSGGAEGGYNVSTVGIPYAIDSGSGAIVTGDGETRTVAIYASASGTNMNNLTFKPMICLKSDWDASHNFEPYAPTNRELYELIMSYHSGT